MPSIQSSASPGGKSFLISPTAQGGIPKGPSQFGITPISQKPPGGAPLQSPGASPAGLRSPAGEESKSASKGGPKSYDEIKPAKTISIEKREAEEKETCNLHS